ncbi:hypothetical protein LXL04_026487 [Taraxacum kok-saghyz]
MLDSLSFTDTCSWIAFGPLPLVQVDVSTWPIHDSAKNPNFFEERAILTPKNEVVQKIDDRLLSLFPGDEKKYLSSDSLCHSDYLHTNFDESFYSTDVLNGLKPSGFHFIDWY